MVNESTYLIHHGIKGQKWGVRRYQNEDGSLTKAGIKRYYKSDEYGIDRITKEGIKYNNQKQAKLQRYKDSVMYNLKKVNPEFSKEFENYKSINKKNNQHYLEEMDKWFKNSGEYKGKDYYQFKDISGDKWRASKDGKAELESRKKLEKMVNEAAMQHPLYSKDYKRLQTSSIDRLYSREINMDTINFGKEVVSQIMRDLDAESRKEHKDHL